MKIEKISAYAEIISSIAILVTLVYLAVQTQQNTEALISSSRQQSLDSELQLLFKIMDYPEISINPDPAVQPTPQETRTGMMISAFFRIRELQWLQYKDGLLDEDTWASYSRILVLQLKRIDAMKQAWENAEGLGILDRSFMEEIDRKLEE